MLLELCNLNGCLEVMCGQRSPKDYILYSLNFNELHL